MAKKKKVKKAPAIKTRYSKTLILSEIAEKTEERKTTPHHVSRSSHITTLVDTCICRRETRGQRKDDDRVLQPRGFRTTVRVDANTTSALS